MTRDPLRELAAAEQRGDWAEVAAIAEHDLMDLRRAIVAWHHALEQDDGDLAAHSELARLYEVNQMWTELAAALERQLDLVGNADARSALLEKLSAVQQRANDAG